MAPETLTPEQRQYFVRLEIGVSAQFYFDTHQQATLENLMRYFTSARFSNNSHIPRIIRFLNIARYLGCTILGYKNPLSSTSIIYVEFQVEVPEESVNEFELEFSQYFYFI